MNDVSALDAIRRWREMLAAGRYREAWPLYEARRSHPGYEIVLPMTAAPEWLGEDVRGKRVLVCLEQGFGDQITFGRFLPALSALGADVQILCHPAFMGRLFETMGYVTRPFFTDRPVAPCDYWTLIGSLPYRLGLDALPPSAYLPLRRSGGGGVGIVTTGSPAHWNDANRSLPRREAARLRSLGRDLSPAATGAFDFFETAEIVAGLDLVITVDTAVAHLAGALGKPFWVLLPFEGLDWRWGDGQSSPWYPDATLLRQPSPGDWSSVLDQVNRRLGS